jgi:hypothetical protein
MESVKVAVVVRGLEDVLHASHRCYARRCEMMVRERWLWMELECEKKRIASWESNLTSMPVEVLDLARALVRNLVSNNSL